MDGSRVKVRVAGVALVTVIVATFALTGAFYTRAFADPAEVTVEADRAGLVMDVGNKVKMRGVEIGRVGEVRRDGDGVVLVLEIDRGELDRIPADVLAEIRASTVFGAKYVELVAPLQASAARLADGDVVPATSVTTEVNTVFQQLDDVLGNVDVGRLNLTLTVLAQTLEGRGDDIAALAARADAYLTKLEPLLPQVRRALVELARFARLGEVVSPDVVEILRNLAVTGGTIAGESRAVHRLLVDLSVLGGRGAEVLGLNADALATVLAQLRPTTETLRVYSSELPCLFKGLDETRQLMAQVIGGRDAGLRGLVSVRSKLPKYTFPQDLPGIPSGTGPACHALPEVPLSQIPVPEVGEPE